MKNEAGTTKLEMVLRLLGGIAIFATTVGLTYWALVHWQVH